MEEKEVREYLSRYDGFVRRQCRWKAAKFGQEVVEDVEGETIVCLLERLPEKDLSGEDVRPSCARGVPKFFYNEMWRCINAAVKRHGRRVGKETTQHDMGEIVAEESDPCEIAAEREWKKMVLYVCIEQLPQKQRDVLRLHVYDDMPFVDMTGLLGVNSPAISMRYKRALENLRKCLQQNMVTA